MIPFGVVANWGPSLLLGTGLLRGFGDLAGGGILLGDGFDDADGDRLPHVADGEATQRRVVGESFDGHGFGGAHLDDGGVSVLDGFGESFQFFARSTIASLEDLFEFARDMSGMAIHDGRIPILDRSRVVQNDDLGVEVLALFGRVVLRVGSDISSANFFDGDVLDVEADVVTWKSFRERLVVHLHGFDLGGDVSGGEGDDHAGFDDAGFHATNWHCSNASDLVDILEGKTKSFVCRTRWWENSV